MCRHSLRRAIAIFTVTACAAFGAGVLALAQSPYATLPAGDARDKATVACLSCHEARIIVQQRLSKAAWSKELDKMIKWGAEVDPKDRDALIDYFSANFGPDQPAYAAPSSANEPAAKAKK
jgi:hypothetical protein